MVANVIQLPLKTVRCVKSLKQDKKSLAYVSAKKTLKLASDLSKNVINV